MIYHPPTANVWISPVNGPPSSSDGQSGLDRKDRRSIRKQSVARSLANVGLHGQGRQTSGQSRGMNRCPSSASSAKCNASHRRGSRVSRHVQDKPNTNKCDLAIGGIPLPLPPTGSAHASDSSVPTQTFETETPLARQPASVLAHAHLWAQLLFLMRIDSRDPSRVFCRMSGVHLWHQNRARSCHGRGGALLGHDCRVRHHQFSRLIRVTENRPLLRRDR